MIKLAVRAFTRYLFEICVQLYRMMNKAAPAGLLDASSNPSSSGPFPFQASSSSSGSFPYPVRNLMKETHDSVRYNFGYTPDACSSPRIKQRHVAVQCQLLTSGSTTYYGARESETVRSLEIIDIDDRETESPCRRSILVIDGSPKSRKTQIITTVTDASLGPHQRRKAISFLDPGDEESLLNIAER